MGRKICYNYSQGENLLMKFFETKLKGSFIVEIEKNEDERGFFARTYDVDEFKKYGLNSKIVQCSISNNIKKNTLRGMHFQVTPYEETKIINCIKGKIYDVIVDLRVNSDTLYEWNGIELSEHDNKMIYVPKGFAHGFQTLEDTTKVFYQISEFYKPDYVRGIRWNDPKLNIKWPTSSPIMSKKDKKYDLILKNDNKK